MINKLFKYIGSFLLLGIIAFGALYYFYNEPLPEGESGPEADALAHRMLAALHYKKYQNTKIIEWSFRDEHSYKWNKEKEIVDVSWNSYRVALDLINKNSSKAFKNGILLNYEEAQDLIETATRYFNNDSFWLVAPFKVFDRGTTRSLVKMQDGSEALLVTHSLGGDTPGDTYLWILERSGIPKSYKMWVQILPIGGIEASWEGWQKTESGAMLPTKHALGPISLSMGDVKAYNN